MSSPGEWTLLLLPLLLPLLPPLLPLRAFSHHLSSPPALATCVHRLLSLYDRIEGVAETDRARRETKEDALKQQMMTLEAARVKEFAKAKAEQDELKKKLQEVENKWDRESVNKQEALEKELTAVKESVRAMGSDTERTLEGLRAEVDFRSNELESEISVLKEIDSDLQQQAA